MDRRASMVLSIRLLRHCWLESHSEHYKTKRNRSLENGSGRNHIPKGRFLSISPYKVNRPSDISLSMECHEHRNMEVGSTFFESNHQTLGIKFHEITGYVEIRESIYAAGCSALGSRMDRIRRFWDPFPALIVDLPLVGAEIDPG